MKVIGKHGAGVGTPSAAAVAAITMGFIIERHAPNGMMFNSGLLSMMFAAGMGDITRLSGSTTMGTGARPKLQRIMAPMQTC
jgi:hypothetical protein